MNYREDPFLVVDTISLLMPAAIEISWQRMREQMEQEKKESQAILQRYHQSPSTETLSAVQTRLEKFRQLAQGAVESRDELVKMVRSHEAVTDKLEQQAKKAEKRGDSDLAANIRRERGYYEKPLELTRASLKQGEAILGEIQQTLKRAEEYILNVERQFMEQTKPTKSVDGDEQKA